VSTTRIWKEMKKGKHQDKRGSVRRRETEEKGNT